MAFDFDIWRKRYSPHEDEVFHIREGVVFGEALQSLLSGDIGIGKRVFNVCSAEQKSRNGFAGIGERVDGIGSFRIGCKRIGFATLQNQPTRTFVGRQRKAVIGFRFLTNIECDEVSRSHVRSCVCDRVVCPIRADS